MTFLKIFLVPRSLNLLGSIILQPSYDTIECRFPLISLFQSTQISFYIYTSLTLQEDPSNRWQRTVFLTVNRQFEKPRMAQSYNLCCGVVVVSCVFSLRFGGGGGGLFLIEPALCKCAAGTGSMPKLIPRFSYSASEP